MLDCLVRPLLLVLLPLDNLLQGLRALSDFLLPLSRPDLVLFAAGDLERCRGTTRWSGSAQGFSPSGGARSGEEGEQCRPVSEPMLRPESGCVTLVLPSLSLTACLPVAPVRHGFRGILA